MKLADQSDPLAWDTAFWLMGWREPGFPLDETGPRSTELERKLRALGIIALVTEADTDTFLHDLIRAAGVREQFLARWRTAGREDEHELAASRLDGWFDAVAAGDLETAHRIADLSPSDWHASREYEDDFAWAQVLFALLRGTVPDAQAALVHLERALDGLESPRLAVGQALASADPEAFAAAFEALLGEREAQIAAAIAGGEMDDPIVVAHRLVFVEGLALLRLATLRGVATADEYRMCPSLARLVMLTPYPGE